MALSLDFFLAQIYELVPETFHNEMEERNINPLCALSSALEEFQGQKIAPRNQETQNKDAKYSGRRGIARTGRKYVAPTCEHRDTWYLGRDQPGLWADGLVG